jgi:hypothetical protein
MLMEMLLALLSMHPSQLLVQDLLQAVSHFLHPLHPQQEFHLVRVPRLQEALPNQVSHKAQW